MIFMYFHKCGFVDCGTLLLEIWNSILLHLYDIFFAGLWFNNMTVRSIDYIVLISNELYNRKHFGIFIALFFIYWPQAKPRMYLLHIMHKFGNQNLSTTTSFISLFSYRALVFMNHCLCVAAQERGISLFWVYRNNAQICLINLACCIWILY